MAMNYYILFLFFFFFLLHTTITQNNLENECDLLGRLVQREGLHTLIVNLYAGNKGYSLGVRNRYVVLYTC